jgi:predicted dehydrogenase
MRVWHFVDTQPEDTNAMTSEQPPNVYGFGHKAYLEHVVDCIHNKKSALVDGLEGRRSLELITAIYEAIETGREVTLRFKAKYSRLGHA